MQVIGKDNTGHLIGVEPGLIRSTLYRARSLSGLAGLDEFDWEALGSIINSNPIIQGLGAKIAGQGRGVVPINAYPTTAVQASGPGFFGTINPIYLLLGGGLLLFVMMKR